MTCLTGSDDRLTSILLHHADELGLTLAQRRTVAELDTWSQRWLEELSSTPRHSAEFCDATEDIRERTSLLLLCTLTTRQFDQLRNLRSKSAVTQIMAVAA